MGRIPCCDKVGLKKGAWSPEEDHMLQSYIEKIGPGNWRTLPKHAGLFRCGKSCRFRWKNYLKPDVKRGNYSKEEEDTIIRLHGQLGNKWSKIAARLPGRTDNEIKNIWNSQLRKRPKQNPTTQETKSPISVEPNVTGNFSCTDVHPQNSSFNSDFMENRIDGCVTVEKNSDTFQSQFLQAETSVMQPKLPPILDDLELHSPLFQEYLCSSNLQFDEPGRFWLKLLSYAAENEEESRY